MPTLPTPSNDETTLLLAFLAQQRYAAKNAAYGLTDAQAATATTASPLTVGGLIKHLTMTERGWISDVRGAGPATEDRDVSAYLDGFRMHDGDTVAGLIATYDEAAAETDALIAATDLDRQVPAPDAPWCPPGIASWSVRWIMLHLIEETARHAGHADVIRESLDGATSGPLLAAAERWPVDGWMTPWAPAADRAHA